MRAGIWTKAIMPRLADGKKRKHTNKKPNQPLNSQLTNQPTISEEPVFRLKGNGLFMECCGCTDRVYSSSANPPSGTGMIWVVAFRRANATW